MIPVKLTIEGLYSYQKRQTINFKTLTSNHLFGIFGKVGSGKSSILEAITFALYGKTDRLLLKDDNRNYNMMNLKSNQLFIEFDFKIGNEENEYRVNAIAKRNSKNYDDVKKIERSIYRNKNNDYIPITQDELEQAIGLSYDNFKRTIIIPQGKFQEFLQLKSTERTRMMKELFNLHKFELYSNVKNIETKNNALIQNIEGRLEQLGESSFDQHKELKKHKVDVEKNLSSLMKEQEVLGEELKNYQKLKENTEQLLSLKKQRLALEVQKESVNKLENDIGNYEYCLFHFKSSIDALSIHKRKYKELEDSFQQDSNSLKNKNEELEELTITYKNINTEHEKIESLKKEIDGLKKLIEIKTLSEHIEKESDRLKKGTRAVKDVIDKIVRLENEEKSLNNTLSNLKKELPKIETINLAQQWHIKDKNLTNRIGEVNKEIDGINIQISRLKENVLLDLNKFNVVLLDNGIKNKLDELIASKREIEGSIKHLKFDQEHLLIKSGLEKYSKELKHGGSCPLCGSKDHPTPFDSNDLEKEIDNTKKILESQEKKLNQVVLSIQLINNYNASLQPIKLQLSNAVNNLSKLKQDKIIHAKDIIEIYQDYSELELAQKKYKEISEKITSTESQINAQRLQLASENKNKEKYQDGLNKIQREIDKKVNSRDVLTSQVSSEILINHNLSNKELIIEKFQQLEVHIKDTTTRFNNITKQLEVLNNSIAKLSAKIETNKAHFQSEKNAFSSIEKKLKNLIENSKYNDTSEVNTILNLKIDLPKAKETIESYYLKLKSIVSETEKLISAIGQQTYLAEKHQQLIERYEEVTNGLTEFNKQLGKIQLELKTLEEKLKLKEKLNKELNKLQLRATDINTLRKLFFKSGFVNYVSSVYLQNLCATANERFYKMTRQSLSLELNKDNNFEVRDYLNDGKLRNIKTLSGGQTFQAALSLALALADNIQSLTESDRNFFFLDEGFGSLDKDSLEIVFSTLKNLRNENRIVGVISHVEEMQQEISTYLNIEQDEEMGSKIEESWNR